ncbi:MAG: hypothetical protein KC800_22070 [Candidatus Eremiobacteraeota bacterium]|nr:hypothetical protein [Candidatus Eremiobacteraeota bacterium]
MDNNILLEFLRGLAKKLKEDQVEDIDEAVETLQMAQEHLALIYQDYESEGAPPGAEMLRDLMMEALQLMFLGIDEIFNYLESGDLAQLEEGIALAEEGDDIMTSIKHSVENDQQWSGSAHVG